ncbi:MAG: branched-chain amino acid ABC transporter permease [Candidatus Caldarchaeum sp.]|nr:branched-chain amino acid ABC transporter permease [Candidatus Caldarchaeum sp.]MCS7137160.1 branched-chain amino acid ABC transporter permease [Candidatus Caldarchaeum sp.]MDW8359465.1 branched-chain amino acid ABC transporter permease [Candidatus Caldarchaeum sp.]
MNETRARFTTLLALIAIYSVLPLFFLDTPYIVFILAQMIFFTIFAYGFNFLFGFTRQLFLCVGSFAGIGAYITGISLRDGLMGPVEAVVVSTAATALVGWAVSVLSIRRKLVVIFTGIFTLAITLVFNNTVVGLANITGGETGFRIRGFSLGPLDILPYNLRFYYLAAAVLLAATALSYYLIFHTKTGYAYRCIMDDEVSAELVGVDVSRVKSMTALLASALLGFSGAQYGLFSQLIAPSYFAFATVDLPAQIIVILGGRASLLGPYIGSAIITVINEALKFLGPLTQLLYGLILILLLAFFRNGIVDFVKRRFLPWFF